MTARMHVDTIAVEIAACQTYRAAPPLNRRELAAAVRRMTRMGASIAQISERLGCSERQVQRCRAAS